LGKFPTNPYKNPYNKKIGWARVAQGGFKVLRKSSKKPPRKTLWAPGARENSAQEKRAPPGAWGLKIFFPQRGSSGGGSFKPPFYILLKGGGLYLGGGLLSPYRGGAPWGEGGISPL